jgi:hypothetical protein
VFWYEKKHLSFFALVSFCFCNAQETTVSIDSIFFGKDDQKNIILFNKLKSLTKLVRLFLSWLKRIYLFSVV